MFQSLIPPRKARGFSRFIDWIPVFLRNTFRETERDSDLRLICDLFLEI